MARPPVGRMLTVSELGLSPSEISQTLGKTWVSVLFVRLFTV
jgi:hypothetical protein